MLNLVNMLVGYTLWVRNMVGYLFTVSFSAMMYVYVERNYVAVTKESAFRF